MDTEGQNNSELIFYQVESGKTRVEVRLQDETVWLTQKMMADLFQVAVPTINEHIKNILAEGELSSRSTIREFLIVQNEGTRKVSRNIDFFNLEMIVSVGFRGRSGQTA